MTTIEAVLIIIAGVTSVIIPIGLVILGIVLWDLYKNPNNIEDEVK